jgi:hypothetical protein
LKIEANEDSYQLYNTVFCHYNVPISPHQKGWTIKLYRTKKLEE